MGREQPGKRCESSATLDGHFHFLPSFSDKRPLHTQQSPVFVSCRSSTRRSFGGDPPILNSGRAYKIKHFLVFFSFLVSRAARVACSNTSRTPSFVLAEHSRYFWAPIFLRTS